MPDRLRSRRGVPGKLLMAIIASVTVFAPLSHAEAILAEPKEPTLTDPVAANKCKGGCKDGQCWEFLPDDSDDIVNVCCPNGQLPTGDSPPKQFCQQKTVFGKPGKGWEVKYCAQKPPLEVYCPTGQHPTCDPDKNSARCVANKGQDDQQVSEAADYWQNNWAVDARLQEGEIF